MPAHRKIDADAKKQFVACVRQGLAAISRSSKQLEQLAERIRVAEAGLGEVQSAAASARGDFVAEAEMDASTIIERMEQDVRQKERLADAAIRDAFMQHVAPRIQERLVLWALSQGLRGVNATKVGTEIAEAALEEARRPKLPPARSA